MLKTLHIPRLIKILLLTAASLIVLVVVLFFIARYVLSRQGISYEKLSFRFPSTATVEGLRVESDALSLQAGTVQAQWSWRALLQGDIKGKLFVIRDAVIRIKPSTAEPDTTSSVPLIEIDRALIENVGLEWANQSDSSSILFQQVDAVGVRYDGTLTLDTLINKGSRYVGTYALPDTAQIVSDSVKNQDAFSIRTIPGFRVGHFAFNDCVFNIKYGERHYAVDQFNLAFSGLNNHDILDMSLERLSFRYQDSLDVDLLLHDANINSENDAHLKNIFLDLPGLRLSIPELTLTGREGFGVAATFDSTYVNTDLINFFFPALKTWLPVNNRIGLHGQIAYHSGRLSLNRTTVALGNDGTVAATGFMEFEDAGDSVKLDIHELRTTLFGISKWGKIVIPAGQANLPIQGEALATGTRSSIHSTGKLVVQQTRLHYTADVRRQPHGMAIELAVESPLVEPKKILTTFEQDFRVAGLSLKGAGSLGTGGDHALRFEFDGDSLYTGKQWMDAPHVTGSYAPTSSVVSVVSGAGAYTAHVDIKGNVLSGESLSCSGSVALALPPINHAPLTGGDFYTRFSGTVVPHTPALDLVFDTVRFKPKDHQAYSAKGQLTAEQLSDQSFRASLSIGEYATVNALVGADFATWLESENKLTHFPTAQLSVSLHSDTTLVRAITGISAHVEIDELKIVSRTNDLSVNFLSDTLYWKEFHTHQLAGVINYHPGSLTARIQAPELITPVTLFDSVRFEVATQRDSLFTISLNTYLPEIERPLGVSYHIASLHDSLRISFADSTLLLGANQWRADQSGALFISRAFDDFSGTLRITHGSQGATLKGAGKELLWELEGLDLFPITQTLTTEPVIHGVINASVYSNFVEGTYRWDGTLSGASVDTVSFGDLGIRGLVTSESASMSGQLRNNQYEITGKLDKSRDEPSRFNVRMKDVNLAKFASLLPVPPSTLTVIGILNAEVTGTYGENGQMKGFVSLPNTEIISAEYDVYLKSDNDSLVLNGTTAKLNDFVFRDRRGNPITVDGNIQLTESAMDISIKTDRLKLLDHTQTKSTLTGEVDLACDVRIQGHNGNYKVSGNLATLDGASVTYLYKNTITLDDREQEMEFVSFSQQDVVVRSRPKRRSTHKPLEWDVTFNVGQMDVNVLFSQVNQDHITTTAKGKVSFKTGSGAEPSAYGLIESNSGTIAYHVPMISDLRMTIAKAGVRWVGDAFKPLLSFNGSQVFRITPNEISSLWTNKTDRWPISVIAKVNDRPLNDLVLDFDLSSTNNQVSDWISSLPADTREAYAVSLLIRGRINTGGTADVNLLTQTMVSKMNEISSRNIKSADVSFYDESRGPNSAEGGTSKIGYSISKGIINKKVRIVVGGSVDLTGRADPLMPDVKVEYVLREDPTITLRAGKANVYTGVIDGNVDESSFGFTYIKRFRNLFKGHKNRKKE